MCVGPPKPAEHLVLAALFFGTFFCASKRKDKQFVSPKKSFGQDKEKKGTKEYSLMFEKDGILPTTEVIV